MEDFKAPKPGVPALVAEMRYMGQDLANPLTVEGWHTGQEWIDSGTLVERINFTPTSWEYQAAGHSRYHRATECRGSDDLPRAPGG